MLLTKKNFKEIINHTRIKNFLINIYNTNKLCNNLLFIGPEGCGHLLMALKFISTILNIKNYHHPDLYFIFPQHYKNTQDDMIYSNWHQFIKNSPYGTLEDWITMNTPSLQYKYYINIKKINFIIQKLYLKSFYGNYKIVLIWMPETLNVQAANKLLKIIEEPPKYTIFILVGVNKSNIIPSIISRMQLIIFKPLNEVIIKSNIIKIFNLKKDKANQITLLANGNWNTVLKIIKNINYDKYKKLFFFLLKNIIIANKNLNSLTNFINLNIMLNKIGIEEQKLFIQYCITQWRKIFLFIINHTNKQTLNDLIQNISIENWNFFIKKINIIKINNIVNILEEHYLYIQNNINAEIILLNVWVEITKIFHK